MEMKFKFAKLLALGAVALMTFSCGEDEAEEAGSFEGTATIEGIVYFESDQTDDSEDIERAEDVTVRLSYDQEELSIASDGTSLTVVMTTKTDSEGKFSFSVPATNDGVDYTIETDQYETSYTISQDKLDDDGVPLTDNDGDVIREDITKEGIFASQETSASPLIGETEYVELTLDSDPEIDLDK